MPKSAKVLGIKGMKALVPLVGGLSYSNQKLTPWPIVITKPEEFLLNQPKIFLIGPIIRASSSALVEKFLRVFYQR